MQIKREWLEELIFGTEASRRFTQDSPVLPDVWIAYGTALAAGEDPALDLLLTPHQDYTAGQLFCALQQRLERLRPAREGVGPPSAPPGAAYHQSAVVVRLRFEELLLAALPLTGWWQKYICRYLGRFAGAVSPDAGWERMAGDISRALRERAPTAAPADLVWLTLLVGSILGAREAAGDPELTGADAAAVWKRIVNDPDALVRRFRDAVMAPMEDDAACDHPDAPACLFMVSHNRGARPTLTFSVQAVKGDAARRVFDAHCSSLAWAIIDSGVDATHPAFRQRDPATSKPCPEAFRHDGRRWVNQTRVVATFDFTRIRQLLAATPQPAAEEVRRIDESIAEHQARADELRRQAADADAGRQADLEHQIQLLQGQMDTLRKERERWNAIARDDSASAKALREALSEGRMVDWDKIRPLIEVSHEGGGDAQAGPNGPYRPPRHEHGTHVAGILAADWRVDDWGESEESYTAETLAGVCPDIRLYDFRVFDDQGNGDEFSVMAALQFLRYLNEHRDLLMIHGANLSLAIRHDVANFACGRTPVCDEAERVVNSGVVVVAAAGNYGYNRFATLTDVGAPSTYEGYSNISITDPGNAEAVLTVGSTHRIEPHTYGVSYFSSRGPTGDGRFKPDLVAPGEKIKAPIPGVRVGVKDGTSMAAPHVSGAAALIMARHREFIGRPGRVKQILCGTATDLGRDRYFQGAGMLDILRALQSV